MNGVHDMGGMHGMGPIVVEENEPVFHAEWEGRIFALVRAMGVWGRWNTDMSRHARERIPPSRYLESSYYERFAYGLETLLVENEFLTREEIEERMAQLAKDGNLMPLFTKDMVPEILRLGENFRVDEDIPPKFKPGDRVRARDINPAGHTRLPRYTRGRQGVIERDYGVFIFPDTNAQGEGKKPQHLYSVRFMARELWGPEARAQDRV